MATFTIDAGLNGLLEALEEMGRGDGVADIRAWLDDIGASALAKLATTDEDVWTYFEILATDGHKDALDFIGGERMYTYTVGRACRRARDAFETWLATRPLVPLGPRLRSSALAS